MPPEPRRARQGCLAPVSAEPSRRPSPPPGPNAAIRPPSDQPPFRESTQAGLAADDGVHGYAGANPTLALWKWATGDCRFTDTIVILAVGGTAVSLACARQSGSGAEEQICLKC